MRQVYTIREGERSLNASQKRTDIRLVMITDDAESDGALRQTKGGSDTGWNVSGPVDDVGHDNDDHADDEPNTERNQSS